MNQQSIIYKFLLTPQFKIWRYLALIVFFTIVSLNQALAGYVELIPNIGRDLYWIVPITILIYIIAVYLLKRLTIRYLFTGEYMLLVISIVLCAVLFTTVSNVIYYSYMSDYDFFSEVVLTDNLSGFMLYILCILGVITPIFLKEWIISRQYLNKLKVKQTSSQVEQFKEQINPPFFFEILGKSKHFVETEPDKASNLLMKLSQLLRYQLYDCNRQEVLLTAEIAFLRNFLELEKLSNPQFDSTMITDGNIINGVFVYPSVILPYVQSVINALTTEKRQLAISIQADAQRTIIITINTSDISNNILFQKELMKIRERLNALYKDRYELKVNNDKAIGATEIVLQLEKE